MNNFSHSLSERQRKNAVEAFIKLKSKLLGYKNKIISEELAMIERIHKANIETLKVLETYNKNLDKIISQVLSWNQIDQSQQNRQLGALLTLPAIDLSQFKNIFLPGIIKNTACSGCVVSGLQNFSVPKRQFLWDQSNLEKESKKFKSYSLKFVSGIKNIAIFNVKWVMVTHIENLTQFLDDKAAKCLLPDGNLFFHSKNKCLILYPFNYLRSIPAYKSSFLKACAIYIDGFVYLFRGLPKMAAKLNINDEKWSPLSIIPFKFGQYATCAQFKNYILLSSCQSTKIFYYDISIDSYSEIPLNGIEMVTKAIFVKNDKAFLLEFSRFIYESDESLMVWNKVGQCIELMQDIPIKSHSIEYKGKFYFTNSYGVYSFDFKEKCIDYMKMEI